jgi:hypothetical protein
MIIFILKIDIESFIKNLSLIFPFINKKREFGEDFIYEKMMVKYQ